MLQDYTLIESLLISSELKNLNQVEDFINHVCDLKKINEEVYGNVLIAVTEAVNNAIIHGNCFQVDKLVDIQAFEDQSFLYFKVKDSGNGFDYLHLPDPTAPENIEKENGRGIFLIQNLSDHMDFVNPGNQIIIGFSYDSAN